MSRAVNASISLDEVRRKEAAGLFVEGTGTRGRRDGRGEYGHQI